MAELVTDLYAVSPVRRFRFTEYADRELIGVKT